MSFELLSIDESEIRKQLDHSLQNRSLRYEIENSTTWYMYMQNDFQMIIQLDSSHNHSIINDVTFNRIKKRNKAKEERSDTQTCTRANDSRFIHTIARP